jgi:hypothetical protein
MTSHYADILRGRMLLCSGSPSVLRSNQPFPGETTNWNLPATNDYVYLTLQSNQYNEGINPVAAIDWSLSPS